MHERGREKKEETENTREKERKEKLCNKLLAKCTVRADKVLLMLIYPVTDK